jgi:hypothetical protein
MIQAPRPRPPEVRPIATWQVGLIVTGLSLLVIVIIALVYRILTILIGEQLTQLTIALAVVAGITAMGIDYVTGLLSSREREALSAAAEREGRSL